MNKDTKAAQVDWIDIQELAIALLGIDENSDFDETEEALTTRFEISFDQFRKVVEALVPFTMPAQAVISRESFQGFVNVKDNTFIVKVPFAAGKP